MKSEIKSSDNSKVTFVPYTGTEDVMWTCKFRNGTIKRFKFPIRTTPEGQANAYADLKGKDIESQLLATEESEGRELPKPIATV